MLSDDLEGWDGGSSRESSVQFSHSVMSDSLQPHGLQHSRLPCSSLSPGICSDLLLSGILQFTHNFEPYDGCIIMDKFL